MPPRGHKLTPSPSEERGSRREGQTGDVPSDALYEILNVPPDASTEQIQAAFRRLSKKVHPDQGGSNALFCRVKNAYDTLSDPRRRAEYDQSLKVPAGASNEVAQGEAPRWTTMAPTVSLVFSGSLSYTNGGPITSGSLKVEPSTGAVSSVTGRLTIPGATGGTATISVDIARVLGLYIGVVTFSDPEAHLSTVAVVLSATLTRTATGQLTGTASGLYSLRPYTLKFTL